MKGWFKKNKQGLHIFHNSKVDLPKLKATESIYPCQVQIPPSLILKLLHTKGKVCGCLEGVKGKIT